MQAGHLFYYKSLVISLVRLYLVLPVALLVGMRREAVGACYSVDREPNVAIYLSTNLTLALLRAVVLWACTSVAFLSVLCGPPY